MECWLCLYYLHCVQFFIFSSFIFHFSSFFFFKLEDHSYIIHVSFLWILKTKKQTCINTINIITMQCLFTLVYLEGNGGMMRCCQSLARMISKISHKFWNKEKITIILQEPHMHKSIKIDLKIQERARET